MSAYAALQPTTVCSLRGNTSRGSSSRTTRRAASRATTTAAAASPRAIVQATSTADAPLVKVCGVTTVEDATQAATAGATFVGMILWPKSKRSISLDAAVDVAAAAKAAGATPVGVFVDETAEGIIAGESFAKSFAGECDGGNLLGLDRGGQSCE